MMADGWWYSRAIDTPCVIEIEQTHDFFHAHVTLERDIAIQPGDRVLVHGAPVRIAFGEKLVEQRMATVEQASWLARLCTRLAARFEFAELYEVSFTTRRTL